MYSPDQPFDKEMHRLVVMDKRCYVQDMRKIMANSEKSGHALINTEASYTPLFQLSRPSAYAVPEGVLGEETVEALNKLLNRSSALELGSKKADSLVLDMVDRKALQPLLTDDVREKLGGVLTTEAQETLKQFLMDEARVTFHQDTGHTLSYLKDIGRHGKTYHQQGVLKDKLSIADDRLQAHSDALNGVRRDVDPEVVAAIQAMITPEMRAATQAAEERITDLRSRGQQLMDAYTHDGAFDRKAFAKDVSQFENGLRLLRKLTEKGYVELPEGSEVVETVLDKRVADSKADIRWEISEIKGEKHQVINGLKTAEQLVKQLRNNAGNLDKMGELAAEIGLTLEPVQQVLSRLTITGPVTDYLGKEGKAALIADAPLDREGIKVDARGHTSYAEGANDGFNFAGCSASLIAAGAGVAFPIPSAGVLGTLLVGRGIAALTKASSLPITAQNLLDKAAQAEAARG
jgi:hypothetical protein